MAKTIEQRKYGGKRNKIVDAFIEVIQEDPDIEILHIGNTKVVWRFKIDSEPVQKIAPGITSFEQMTKPQRRAYDKLEKKYNKKAAKAAKEKLGGTMGLMKEIMGD